MEPRIAVIKIIHLLFRKLNVIRVELFHGEGA